MRGTKAKRLRREFPEKVPVYTEPLMLEIAGKLQYIPRRARRAMYRQLLKGLKTGKISLEDIAKGATDVNDRPE